MLYTADGMEQFGPDLLEAVRMADLLEYGRVAPVHPPDRSARQNFARHGGRYEWLEGFEIEHAAAILRKGPTGRLLAKARGHW